MVIIEGPDPGDAFPESSNKSSAILAKSGAAQILLRSLSNANSNRSPLAVQMRASPSWDAVKISRPFGLNSALTNASL